MEKYDILRPNWQHMDGQGLYLVFTLVICDLIFCWCYFWLHFCCPDLCRWVYHHYCAILMALVSLTWEIKGKPDCANKQVIDCLKFNHFIPEKRCNASSFLQKGVQLFLVWAIMQGIAMLLQNRYQRQRLYTRIALGKVISWYYITFVTAFFCFSFIFINFAVQGLNSLHDMKYITFCIIWDDENIYSIYQCDKFIVCNNAPFKGHNQFGQWL